jgi:AcrR family transcriptional regulator
MGIAERRYRQKEEIRCLILQTAWKQVREEGVQALSIRKIADAIEYSVPVIYSHFESKEALLKEFVEKGYCLLTAQLEEAKAARADAPAQLEAMAEAYWDFASQNREYYQLMFGLGIPNCEMARSIPEIGAFGKLVQSVIREAIALGRHPGADVFLKYQSYWSILHGIISIRLHGPRDLGHGDLDRMILKDTIAGFIYALVGAPELPTQENEPLRQTNEPPGARE